MGSRSLFPVVAVPLAFFCTLFFRHRKKSVSAPWDGKSLSAPESARQAPSKGNFLRQSCRVQLLAGGFPRGKQSTRPALPCAPLVVCLNSGSLTAFGGCIHWIPASLRSPLETFGSPPEAIERPLGRPVPIRAGLGASSPAMRLLPPFPQNSIQILLRGSDGIQPIGLYQRLDDGFR